MLTLIKRLISDDRGQGLTEYALVIALVSVAVVAVVALFKDSIEAVFTGATTTLEAATP